MNPAAAKLLIDVTIKIGKKLKSGNKANFSKAQKVIDRECMKGLNEFVPIAPPSWNNSGKLKAGLKNPEPGKLIYTTSFARFTYYDTKKRKNRGNPKGTRMWFETMKSEYADEILEKAQRAATGDSSR